MNITILFQGLSTLAWLAVVGLFVFSLLRASRNNPLKRSGYYIMIAAIVAIFFTALGSGLVFINPDERGVVISAVSPKGYREQALEPGIHFIVPFAENVVRYPISRQTYTMSATQAEGAVTGDDSVSARTSDGQEIFIDASIIYQIDPAKVVQVHIEWQNRYPTDLVRAQARGIIRDSVSQFAVQDIYGSKRLELVGMLHDAMASKLSDNGLMLVDFVMRNLTFSKDYAASVEQKQIAEQQAQQAKYVVESKKQEAEQARQVAQGQADAAVTRAQGDAKARLIQADAEAKSLDLIANALQGKPELLTYQYITKLSPNIQAMLLPSNSPFVFPLPQLNSSQPSATDTGAAAQPTAAPTLLPTPTEMPTPTATPTP